MLSYQNVFLLGVYSILFLFYIIQFIIQREEKYNLFFSLGCGISLTRILVMHLIPIYETKGGWTLSVLYLVHYFSFLWGPVFCMKLATSLFERDSNKKINTGIVILVALVSIFVLVTPLKIYASFSFYDYIISSILIYSCYIFTRAVVKKRKYALPLCIGNYIMCFGIIYDVLLGENIINSSFGELNIYAYFVYLLIYAVVLANISSDVKKTAMKNEICFLNAQIQPHFLFNSINTIITYCRVNPDIARELLIELSTYLRGKFKYNASDMYTLLKDELEVITAYLAIEKARFKDRLQIKYEIDENIDILIPCLIFQPIVENAVKHGIVKKREGGTVLISVKRQGNDILLMCEDDGPGMDTSRLPAILYDENSNSGIGLANTNKRLKAIYNKEIIIQSQEGKGTKAIVAIPIKENRNVKERNH